MELRGRKLKPRGNKTDLKRSLKRQEVNCKRKSIRIESRKVVLGRRDVSYNKMVGIKEEEN